VILEYLCAGEHPLRIGPVPEQQGDLFLGQCVAQLLRPFVENGPGRPAEVSQALAGHVTQQLGAVTGQRARGRQKLLHGRRLAVRSAQQIGQGGGGGGRLVRVRRR